MNKYKVVLDDNTVVLVGTAEIVREYLESRFAEKFNFLPMFQESEDEGCLEVYLHTDTYEDLEEPEIAKLVELGIKEFDSLQVICSLLNIRVEQTERIVNCSFCNKVFVQTKSHKSVLNFCEKCLLHPEKLTFKEINHDVAVFIFGGIREAIRAELKENQKKRDLDIQTKRLIAVYSFGGIVDSIEEGTDLQEMAKEMRAYLDEQGFDGERDDARIFQVNGGFSKVVYSFQTRETLLENDDIEVYSPLDGTIKIFGRNTKEDMIVFYDPEQNFGHQ